MVRGTVVVLAAFAVASCSAGPLTRSDKPPRYEPVGDTVIVSADGRVITATAAIVCGHAQRLVARSSPDKVVLTIENPVRNCKDPGNPPEITLVIAASTRLRAPLGKRALIRVGQTRGTIPYFDERDLASIRRLPFGLRLSSDEPTDAIGPRLQPEPGDIRRYMSSKAFLEITQIAPSPAPTARPYFFSTRCAITVGWHPPHGNGTCRSVTWVARGYRFLVRMVVARGMPLSKKKLRTIAGGILAKGRRSTLLSRP